MRKNKILVVKINHNGKICNSRPCNNCIKYLIETGIKKIYYSDGNDNIICEKLKDMDRTHISSGYGFFGDNKRSRHKTKVMEKN